MADTKRQSVASGKAASQADLSKAIGSTIRISTTVQSHTIEGTLVAVDASLDLVAIRELQASGSFHITPISQISNFKVVSPGTSGDSEQQQTGKADIEGLKTREAKAIADAKKAEAKLGKGVSAEAQELFDHLSRLLPCRWAGQQIIVSDSVVIDPPYGLENMKAPPGKQQAALEQTKKIAGGFWTKKKTGVSGTSTPVNNGPAGPPARVPVPNVQRKGG